MYGINVLQLTRDMGACSQLREYEGGEPLQREHGGGGPQEREHGKGERQVCLI